MAKSPTVPWTPEHRLVALNLYFKLPFGKLDKGNPLIVDAARKMGRTPSSLAMKLCNFASLDPVLHSRGVRGLPGVAEADRRLWDEFHANAATLIPDSEQLLHDLYTDDPEREVDFLQRDKVRVELPTGWRLPSGPTETTITAKARRGQQFFRQTVLTAFDRRCCISGINVPRLLVASHIRPWSKFPADRLNPRNGLCLSSLHDAAFDDGLITLDQSLRVVLSGELRRHFPQPVLEQNFVPFAGQPITFPVKSAEPDPEFLEYHRSTIFAG